MNDPAANLDATPTMGSEVRERGRELSLQRLRPPLKVPGYEQEQFVGRGAFGEVWSAIDSNSGRRVAIKFYSRRGGLDWANMAREVEKLRFLFTDRYVVQLLEVGWDADPPYFVMEYMPFGSLAELLHGGPLPIPEAVKMFREIATGIVHAHGKGVLHCDLKPSNIMLDQDGKPRVADFGQSRMSHEQVPSLGTFFYMAPEQADARAVPDVRWDVYALGAILYQMVTGKAPHLSDESLAELSSHDTIESRLEAYRRHLETSPRPSEHRRVRGIDAALVRIIDRSLATNPKHRYPNVQAVLDALSLRETRRSQRPMLLLGALGPATVILIMATIAWWLFRATLGAAETQLIGRTLESNSFAAYMVAGRFELEVDKRWRALEREANDPLLHSELERLRESDSAAAARARLQPWIEHRQRLWNAQFTAGTRASSWFIVDRRGRLQAVSPPNSALIGTYFGYRDYFHGGGADLKDHDSVPRPISGPHRSSIFLSHPRNVPAVAFSVPIRDRDAPGGEPLGVLVMEADLGHFAEFVGARNQFAVLVDLRPDEQGTRGLIIEHPRLSDEAAGFERHYLDPSVVTQLDRLRQDLEGKLKRGAADDAPIGRGGEGQFDVYRDPLDPRPDEAWLCAAEPVFIARGTGEHYDSGWAVLIQESRAGVMAPLHRLWRMVLFGGLLALGLVTLILTALWGYVLLRLNVAEGPRRWLRHLTGLTETVTTSTSGRLGSSSETAPSS